MHEEKYDIIIIGTGAGGGTLAYRLAPTGKKILILERGGYIPREPENWDSEEVLLKGRYRAKEKWADKTGEKFSPVIHYNVGGNTKIYGSALFRMRERDFAETRHYDGISPAWDIAYSDLAEYYTAAEYLYTVHGRRGSDPTEPPADRPYPHPPLPHEPRLQELFDNLKTAGLQPFPIPIGVKSDAAAGQSGYVLDRFDGYPDPTEMKSEAHVNCIKIAVTFPNVTLKTHCLAEKLETDATGKKITGVRTAENGERKIYRADTVVVACGAVNSAALLLRSANEKHPRGLANGSDMVGRNFMMHHNSIVFALSKKPNYAKFGKTLAVNDFYFGSEDFKFPMGMIQMMGKSDAVVMQDLVSEKLRDKTAAYLAAHVLDFWLTTEDLPHPDNRVVLDSKGGIQLNYTPNNRLPHDKLIDKLKELLAVIGCENDLHENRHYLNSKMPLGNTAHQCGTLRMGNDPANSVVDIHNRSHEIDNLFVADSSVFVSSSAVNPGLTTMALALRLGDYLRSK